LLAHQIPVEKFTADYNNSSEGNCIIRYGDLKKQLAEDMAAFIKPIREKAADLQQDTDYPSKNHENGRRKSWRKRFKNANVGS